MTRIVGTQNRFEFILDPAEALRRGALLDRMGPNLLPPRPHGVQRASHAEFNRQDDLRALEQAKLMNGISNGLVASPTLRSVTPGTDPAAI